LTGTEPIVVVDYGMGNVGSILNMLRKVGTRAEASRSVETIGQAARLILPGVGAFDAGMQSIEERGLRQVLDEKALVEKVPVLGICLGAQLMTSSSEEGNRAGLGWIPGRTVRFSGDAGLKVPHMGWNRVAAWRDSPLTEALPAELCYYFVHSYYIRAEHEQDVILKTTYGVEFASGIRRDNIYGVQFHPEKSHRFGLTMLKNFAGC
jgi:glutamine amidotransferase